MLSENPLAAPLGPSFANNSLHTVLLKNAKKQKCYGNVAMWNRIRASQDVALSDKSFIIRVCAEHETSSLYSAHIK